MTVMVTVTFEVDTDDVSAATYDIEYVCTTMKGDTLPMEYLIVSSELINE